MSTLSRTERHRADSTKAGGVVYTPPELARFLAAQTFDALEAPESVRILDPACGDGELLLAAVAEAERRSITVQSVVGYDIDGAAIAKAAERLSGISSVSLHEADFVALAADFTGPQGLFEVDDQLEQLQFEVVISNPPYVRTQTLGSDFAQVLGRRFGLTGRVDLYQAFSAAMIQALVQGGALGLLCSNKFLTNRAGTSMRKLLIRELDLHELVDLGDTKLFEAAVLPVIVSGSRATNSASQDRPRFRSVYEVKPALVTEPVRSSGVLEALTDSHEGQVEDEGRVFSIRDGLLDLEAGAANPWNPMDEDTRAKFEVLRRGDSIPLGNVSKIRVGVKTTADPVFIRSDWSELPEEERPEEELLRPLLTHRDVDAWNSTPGLQRALYPHVDDKGRAVPVDLSQFPRAAAYLEIHREQLEGRQYVIDAGRQWFEMWVPQKPALWSLPKVVFPDIAEFPRFAVDRSGAIVNGDCYWMVIEDEDLLEVVAAVGNSTFCTWFYDSACGNFLYAGRRRFMTQYMERLPIPKPTPALVEQIRELRSSDRLDELDDLVWSALGIEKV